MSLIEGDSEKRLKLYRSIKKFSPYLAVISYLAGIVYFVLLPHEDIVHNTYMSENALSPGLVNTDRESLAILTNYHKLLKTSYKE